MAAAARGGSADPYFLDWQAYFSPIESLAWCSIRGAGIPMYPQYPTRGVFLDFADPAKRIALECDGKQWHDKTKDAERDRMLRKGGWEVYRVTGAECVRPADMDLLEEADVEPELREGAMYADAFDTYAFRTVDGVVDAIATHHYGRSTRLSRDEAAMVLLQHEGR